MAASTEHAERRVVPRWRLFRDALKSNELSASAISAAGSLDGRPFLEQKERAWLENQSLPFALDLLSASAALGNSSVASDAAQFVLEQNDLNASAESLARHALNISSDRSAVELVVSRDEVQRALKELKSRRVTQGKNAFIWVDLARLYVLLDQLRSASDAMRVALNLAPYDRFVLRSATRFLLHSKKPEEALRLLRKNPKTPSDPWLVAAEIAVSSVNETTPRYAKLGREILKSHDVSDFHVSELASSLGSLELFEGNSKAAKKLFATSLKNPTDNALAQAVWADKVLRIANLDEHLTIFKERVGFSEARAISLHNQGDWKEAISSARKWTQDESFSARPRQFAAATASSFLNRFDLAVNLGREGLVTNPGHPGLINNIAFALASSGQPLEALQELERIDKAQITRIDAICLVATAGLAYFRIGNSAEGRNLYQRSIAAAARGHNRELEVLASLYLAREEVRAGNGDGWKMFEAAKKRAEEMKTTFFTALSEHLGNEVSYLLEHQGSDLFK